MPTVSNFHSLSLCFHCLSSCFHCLFLRFHDLSVPKTVTILDSDTSVSAGGDSGCWSGFITFDTCGCEESVDCAGGWSDCDAGCQRVYLISTAQAGSAYSMGAACEAENNTVQVCSAGEGACPISGDECTGLAAPSYSSLGDCPSDGTLAHVAVGETVILMTPPYYPY